MTVFQLPQPTAFESTISEKNTHLFILKNRSGMQIALTDYGARLVSALIPDKHGNLVDVVLGFDSIDKYLNAQEQYHGATIGRVCNRIADGKFTIKDKDYILSKNNNSNALHGGPEGFHRKVWDRQVSFKKNIDFYYISPDGEEGYPGKVTVHVNYELSNDNEIIIKYRATTDQVTVLNMTNHAYFNLNGEGNGTILNHFAQINATEYLPINDQQIPTGTKESVVNTVFDFKEPMKLGHFIHQNDDQLKFANGYDHSYINNNPLEKVAATILSEDTGIQLDVLTDLPTIHLYTGNYLANDKGKSGKEYQQHGGFCLEAQHYINSPNQENFTPILLNPGEEYTATIIYKFSIKK